MQAIEKLNSQWQGHLSDLERLVKIPSVSFPGFSDERVQESAQAVADIMKARGLENVELIDPPTPYKTGMRHPYVYGDWMHAGPDAPTLLLYAHHDVQPPGRAEVWKSEPFEPTTLDGPEGQRMFGRGTADDKAGVIIHTAAIAAVLEAEGKLPVNIKVLIEGEEEIGSPHLLDFLKAHRKKFDADVLVLTDTLNYDSGVPALTIALRGMVALDVEVRGLSKTVHSGMWGGPVPDPVMGLCKTLSALADDEGQIAVPEIQQMIRDIPPEKQEEYKKLPFNEKRFREQSGMVSGARILQKGVSPMSQLWTQPALCINALQASSRAQAGNIICDTAWARVGLRLSPGMDPERVASALENAVRQHLPWGLECHIERSAVAGPWETDSNEPKNRWAFEAAHLALGEAYDHQVYEIGCGGSIPFVEPFARALEGAPALLVGVEDPFTNAHGENESLLLSDFKKSAESEIRLFSRLAEAWQKR